MDPLPEPAEVIASLRVVSAFEAANAIDVTDAEALYWPATELPFGLPTIREALSTLWRVARAPRAVRDAALPNCDLGSERWAWRLTLLTHALGSYLPPGDVELVRGAVRALRRGETPEACAGAQLAAALEAERRMFTQCSCEGGWK